MNGHIHIHMHYGYGRGHGMAGESERGQAHDGQSGGVTGPAAAVLV
ncbi:hypothetical protein [Yinghuangia sp. YIM S10712]